MDGSGLLFYNTMKFQTLQREGNYFYSPGNTMKMGCFILHTFKPWTGEGSQRFADTNQRHFI